jgi:CIC family chloride channel protein
VFLGDLAVVTFTPVVVAAVAGTAVSVLHEGAGPVFDLSGLAFRLQSVWEIPLYAVLGLVCACGAVLFTRVLYVFEDAIDAVKVPALLKPALGGLAVGAIGIAMPEVLGIGYDTIDGAYRGGFALPALCGLFFVKLAATCVTLGSGGSGGVFAPSLVLGAVLGAGFGEVAGRLLPGATAPAGVYSVVGMAALVAGTTHAPMSAILILFEMTRDYDIMLPLMLACVLSSTAARGLFRDSIYTLKLARRGVRLRAGRDAAVLRTITVGETMSAEPTLLHEGLPFRDVRRLALGSHFHVFPVVDAEDRFRGLVTLDWLRAHLMEEGLLDVAVAGDLARSWDVVLHPDDDLERAREMFDASGLDELPVLEVGTDRVLGVLKEYDLRDAYNRSVAHLQ